MLALRGLSRRCTVLQCRLPAAQLCTKASAPAKSSKASDAPPKDSSSSKTGGGGGSSTETGGGGSLHSSSAIAFKPSDGGWGYTPEYKSAYARIFSKGKEALNQNDQKSQQLEARREELRVELKRLADEDVRVRAELASVEKALASTA